MKDKLLEKMFEYDRWVDLIAKMNDQKGLNKGLLRQLATPEVRLRLYEAIRDGNYRIAPAHEGHVPKDNGEIRVVYICEDIDRCVLSLINDALFELFPDMVDSHCKSYLKGESSQETVQTISRQIDKIKDVRDDHFIGIKLDMRHYFDEPKIEYIDAIFDEVERRLGVNIGEDPVINVLRDFYHNPYVFDYEGNLIQKYCGLKQGASTASFLADVLLKEIDEEMSKATAYVRYSDDALIISPNAEQYLARFEEMIAPMGLAVHPKKKQKLYYNEWFTFLGFQIKGDLITLSKNRTHKITKELVKVTISNPNVGKTQAIKNIKRILYGSDNSQFSWATACFNAMNCSKDVETLNNFIMDLIRICEERESCNKRRKTKGLKPRVIKYGMNDVGGIGIENRYDDHTMTRGTGKKVRTAKQRTEKEIENYISMGCLLGAYKLGKPMYNSVLAGWQ